ncbi:Hypp6445 [Branchiostoma lanceolatum]|uniref:Hypp6445 protein n=1 Tax=Branchiostoma lanceolatum TaxID=7740 RepID=A0A8K0E4A2_BRALA|nr:Hypp6445 [Branchiostoma lanceolatum]
MACSSEQFEEVQENSQRTIPAVRVRFQRQYFDSGQIESCDGTYEDPRHACDCTYEEAQEACDCTYEEPQEACDCTYEEAQEACDCTYEKPQEQCDCTYEEPQAIIVTLPFQDSQHAEREAEAPHDVEDPPSAPGEEQQGEKRSMAIRIRFPLRSIVATAAMIVAILIIIPSITGIPNMASRMTEHPNTKVSEGASRVSKSTTATRAMPVNSPVESEGGLGKTGDGIVSTEGTKWTKRAVEQTATTAPTTYVLASKEAMSCGIMKSRAVTALRGGPMTEPEHPVAAAVSNNYEIFVADYKNMCITVYNTTGASLRQFKTMTPSEVPFGPVDVTVDGEGGVWVAGFNHVMRMRRHQAAVDYALNYSHI